MKEQYETQSEMNKSKQLEFQYQTDLFTDICALETLREAFKAVKRNKGAPGVDGYYHREVRRRSREKSEPTQDGSHELDMQTKFFDRINHDRLIYRLKGHIQDSRILRLIGMILRGGNMKKIHWTFGMRSR